jgi:lysozyme family protein
MPTLPPAPNTGDPLFDRALAVVLSHEGGFTADAADPGGATNYGVSLRFALTVGDRDGDGRLDLDLDGDGDVDAADIRALTAREAADVYRYFWWDRYGYARFHLTIAAKVFDLAVNMGAPQAHKVLQRAVRAASGLALVEDGVLGPKTAVAVADIPPFSLLIALRSEAAGFYRSLIAAKPALAKFETGWLNRAYA